MEGWEHMEDGRENKNPVLRIRVNDLTVIMTFSTNENGRLKDQIRDILTEARGEYLENILSACNN